MSTYRGYIPWKSNLSTTTTTSYHPKSDAGSRYSSRDDVSSTETKTTPRYGGSVTSPISYRPTYSGGTYHSTKRDPPSTTYTSKYATSTAKEPSKEKEIPSNGTASKTASTKLSAQTAAKLSTSTTTAGATTKASAATEPKTSRFLSTANSSTTDSKASKYSTTSSNAANETKKSGSRYSTTTTNEPKTSGRYSTTSSITPSSNDTKSSSRYLNTASISATEPKSARYSSTSSLSPKSKLRDPSPVVERRSTLGISSTIRSRDTSPAATSLYLTSRSRDPSPVDSTIRGRYTSPLRSSYSNSYNILKQRDKPSQYGTSTAVSRTLGPALSYMTASEVTARNKSRREKIELEKRENSVEPSSASALARAARKEKCLRVTPEPEEMIQITVVTRGTSPTPPNAPVPTNFIRTRRADLAKTIEKSIQRSVKRKPCVDKEIQSDRLDDTSKYSRFKNSRIASWTSFLDTNPKLNAASPGYSTRYTNSSPPTSTKTAMKKDSPESDKPKLKSKESLRNGSLSKSSSTKSITKSEKSEKTDKTDTSEKSKSTSTESKPKTNSKLSLSSSSSSSSKQKSENQLPPLAKNLSRIGAGAADSDKWTNKDFRKSALNIGPTDRPRKSRTSSVDSESETATDKPVYQLQRRTERSPSVSSSSEVSSSSSQTEEETNKQSKSVVSPQSAAEKPIIDQQLAPKPTSSRDTSTNASSTDAKSFLIRTLGPVTNIFKSKSSSPHSREQTVYQDENNSTSISESLERDSTDTPFHTPNSNSKSKDEPDESINHNKMHVTDSNTNDYGGNVKNKLRHIDSGELAWWMNSENYNEANDVEDDDDDDDTIGNDITLKSEIVDPPPPDSPAIYKIRHIESGEKAWWMRDSPTNEVSKSSSRILRDSSSNKSVRDSLSKSSSSRKIVPNDISKSSAHNQTNSKENNKIKSEGLEINEEPINRPVYRIRHIESGEKAWWMTEGDGDGGNENKKASTSSRISSESSGRSKSSKENSKPLPKYQIRHIESGEKAWWMQDHSDNPSAEEQISQDSIRPEINRLDPTNSQESFTTEDDMPLGDRASPEGLEDPSKRHSLHENDANNKDSVSKNIKKLFISRHTNIDDLLGGSSHPLSPLMVDYFTANEKFEKITPDQVRIHEGYTVGMEKEKIHPNREMRNTPSSDTTKRQVLDDASLQVYKDGDYGAYLDLECSLAEQAEDIDGLQSSRKNSLIVRTQLSVRVHTIIETLLTSKGRDLRRALFSLKQIFQEDKDLVHGFVALGGLNCLVRVGSGADQNYQNYILRALGQVMLYVDGMNGVMKHGPTIQWLYTLIASKYRLVVKTALKLLLVFVEYVESNAYLLVKAIHACDSSRGLPPWSNIMKLLKDYENSDTELLIYATSLINKTLSGLSDQDSFYDESDLLEQQGMECVIQRYMSRPGTDLDLLDQLQLYEAVLKFEDGETDGIRIPDNSVRKTLRYRAANNVNGLDSHERRKSRRHSTGNSPVIQALKNGSPPAVHQQTADEDSSSSANSGELTDVFNKVKTNRESAGVTPGLRRRRERAERQKTFMKEQQEAAAAGLRPFDTNRDDLNGHAGQIVTAMPVRLESYQESPMTIPIANNIKPSPINNNGCQEITNGESKYQEMNAKLLRNSSSSVLTPNGKTDLQSNGTTLLSATSIVDVNHKTFEDESNRLNDYYSRINQSKSNGNISSKIEFASSSPSPETKSKIAPNLPNGNNPTSAVDKLEESPNEDKKLLLQLKRDHTVKDLTQKLTNLPMSPQEEKPNRIGDMTGLISKAKEGLAKSKSKGEISRSPSVDQDLKKAAEPKKSENELHWEELVQNMDRPLMLCDLDFTDLQLEDDKDNLAPRCLGGSVPPPPPPIRSGGMVAPPPMINLPPPPANLTPPQMLNGGISDADLNGTIKKNKKTVKLFWKEVREDMIPHGNSKTIWDDLPQATIDCKILEHLFESRAKDLMAKKQQEINKNKEIIVLDHKRSNAINIAMTKLPPPRAIKAAILKMDATVVTREGIEKLLNMLPTDEERGKIQEAQVVNPELPLGSAEQFLLTLSSISELAARLKLWAFKLDFEISEKEIAEPLMDLKQGIETLRNNKTFKCILSTLLSIGIFLNGAPVKGFQIEYLAKVPEVKDTVHKHSLLHHLCHMVSDSSPDTTDLYSEIGPITRASKADFADIAHNITYLEKECKASWDRLKLIAKHDCPPQLKQKLIDFLADCAERIIILDIVHRRVINRYRKFMLWLGVPQHRIVESKPNEVCRIVSEFALEYRTTRERVQQQIEKKINHRERNKTRGKMIIDVAKVRTQEDRADAELRQLLGSPNTTSEKLVDSSGTLTWRRRRNIDNPKSPKQRLADENLTDGDDELLETLVKTATKASGPRQTPRERKRTRHADRKSLRRTLKNGITEEELQHAAEIIQNL